MDRLADALNIPTFGSFQRDPAGWVRAAIPQLSGVLQPIVTRLNDLVDAYNVGDRLPAGGATGQLLQKLSGTDYDAGWTGDPSVTSLTTSGALAVGTDADIAGTLTVDTIDDSGAGTVTISAPLTAQRIIDPGSVGLQLVRPGTDAPFISFLNSAGTVRFGFVQLSGTNGLILRNEVVSGMVRLQATDASSAIKDVLLGSPDGTTILYNVGTEKIRTDAAGIIVRTSGAGSNPPVSTDNPGSGMTRIYDTNGIELMRFGAVGGSSIMWLWSLIRSGLTRLRVTGNAGASIDVLQLSSTGASTPQIGFLGTAPISRPTVTGSKGGNAALTSLCTALANLGLITDSTT